MGQIHESQTVMPVCAVTTRYEEAFEWAKRKFAAQGFATALQSEVFEFNLTDYYQSEMGTGLKKMILGFQPARDPSEAPNWKLQSNDWEVDFCQAHDYPESRPVNLDPGYLTLAKFVLLTTKDRDHRLYLRDGIYAEVTMSFSRGSWQPQRWTYPDYQLPEATRFLLEAREAIKQASRFRSEPK